MALMNDQPMKIYALGTHSDWVHSGGAWGRPGHQRVVDLSLAAGISRLYWRTHNGGQAKYPSRAGTICDGSVYRNPDFNGFGALPKSYFAYAQYLDYSQWDQVAEMHEVGSASGLEVCHWYTFLEDDHGGHLGSDFVLAHPEFRCTFRSGEQVPGCLDFWFPEVREHKLAIIDELLEKPTSRLLLDVLRRNGRPSADAAGNYHYGYSPAKLEAFQAATGLDAKRLESGSPDWEAWLDFNAAPLTEFLREVARRTAQKGIPLDLLTWALDTKRWLALDLEPLVADGTVATVLTGTQRYAYSGADCQRQLREISGSLGPAKPGTISPGLFGYHNFPPAAVDAFFSAAREAGCEAVTLHESNHVVESPITDRLRSWSYGQPHGNREVKAARRGNKAVVYSGFIKCHDITKAPCDQNTSFSVTYDDAALHITVEASERAVDQLLPVPGIPADNYNGIALGARAFWNPYESIHVFLDAGHDHEDYFHFVLDPSGKALAETRLNEDWDGDWAGTVAMDQQQWTASFEIPWASLGLEPRQGQTFGFQIYRMQNQPREVSAWFCATGRRVGPAEFGHLVLL